MPELAEIWASILWPLFWKGSILIVACWLATRALWGGSAALRHMIWTSGTVALLLLPLLGIGVSMWSASTGEPHQAQILVNGIEETTEAGAHVVHVSGEEHMESIGAIRSTDRSRTRTLTNTLCVIWIAGALLVSAMFLSGRISLQRLARRATKPADSRLLERTRTLAQDLGLTRRVDVICGDDRQVPATWGVRRSVVLLPTSCSRWDDDRLGNVLLHELAHIQRRDALTQAVVHLACLLCWFNPLVWMMAANMRLEREQACDDLVLAHGSAPVDYATHLVAVTRELDTCRSPAMAGMAMAGPRQLALRVDALLEERRSRGRPGRVRTGLVMAISAALLVSLTAIGQASDDRSGKTATLMTTTPVPVIADTLLVDIPGVGPTTILVIDPDQHLDQPLDHQCREGPPRIPEP